MSIVGAIVLPHPPMIIPQVGRGSERMIAQTAWACREAADFLVKQKPETLLVITPHSVNYRDALHISPGAGAWGDLRRFGAREQRFEVAYDEELRQSILALAEAEDLPITEEGELSAELDHAFTVPLSFIREAAGGSLPFRFLRLAQSGLSPEAHYRAGMLIQKAALQSGRRLGILASGDLSHHLKEDGPYGLRPEGARYDALVMDILGRGAFQELLEMPQELCEQAGECGQRSFLIMAGCLDGREVQARALSYQPVTGVGYGVATFLPGQEDAGRRFLSQAPAVQQPQSEPVQLALQSITHYLKEGRRMPLPGDLPDWMLSRRAGCFVTLHKQEALRGCIGTIAPTRASLAEEILMNAISAATRDPRFEPLTLDELPRLHCSVDVLDEPEDIEGPEQLDPQRYGVIVSSRGRRGLLLPMLEGVDSVSEQLAIARQKAGIGPKEQVSLQRFRVTRYT